MSGFISNAIKRGEQIADQRASTRASAPTSASSIETSDLSPELQAQVQSAKIIETLIEIFGTPQENNRLETSERNAPSSKYNNFLKGTNLLSTQSELINNISVPIGGLYGIVLRKTPGAISPRAAESSNAERGSISAGAAWRLILNNIPGVGSDPDNPDPALGMSALDFPQYYVFIFSNVAPETPIPIILERDDVLDYVGIDSYPKAVIVNKNLREAEELQPGTMIRVEYDGTDNRTKPVIAEIVESDTSFTRMVMNSMMNRSALLSESQCSTDSSLDGVEHPTGDAVAGEGSADSTD